MSLGFGVGKKSLVVVPLQKIFVLRLLSDFSLGWTKKTVDSTNERSKKKTLDRFD